MGVEPDRPLRGAVVGLRHGHIGSLDRASPGGQRGLLGTFSQIPQVELVALCDSDPALLQREGAALPGSRRFDTPAELLDYGEFDFALVGLPAVELPGVAAALLRQGKHCFLEKSIARTAEEFRPVLDAASASGAHCLVDFPWRFHPALVTMRELLDSGVLGRPLMVAAQMVTTQVGSGPGQRNPQHPAYRPETEGGGMLHWLGQHFLEVLSFLGGDVRQVSAMCAPVVGNMDPDPRMDDVSVLAIRFASGAMGALHVGYLNAAPGANRDVVHLWGSEGDAYWPGLGPQLVVNSRAPSWTGSPTRSYEFAPRPRAGVYGNSEWMFQVAVDFVRGIRAGRPPAVGPAEAMRVLQLTDAAYAASASQRWVSLSETP
jgi:predicted dehydrogenase